MTEYNSGNSHVKDITRAIAILQTREAAKLFKKPTCSSLPATSFVYEEAVEDLMGKMFTMEFDEPTFHSQTGKRGRFLYLNAPMRFIGDCIINGETSTIAWADYCGWPSDKNMEIGENTMFGLATFNLLWRSGVDAFLRNNPKFAFFYNRVRKRAEKFPHEYKITAIKRFYEKYYPEYKVVTSIKYVSARQPMLVIGLAHESIADSIPGCFMEETLATENNPDSMKMLFWRLKSIATKTGETYEQYLVAPKKQDAEPKAKIVKEEIQKVDYPSLIQAMKNLGYNKETICHTLSITPRQYSSYNAWTTMRAAA